MSIAYVLFQVSLCLRPQDIMLITLNHMDAMYEFVKDSETVLNQVENVFALLKEVSHSSPVENNVEAHYFCNHCSFLGKLN